MELKCLQTLFDKKLLRIPDYQRGYTWQHKQLKDFWEDLLNLPGKHTHYTGVLTLQEVSSDEISESENEYWLVEFHSYRLYHIVDGQQRLTTFLIFLQAFIEFVKSLPDNAAKTDEEIYIVESLSIAQVTRDYLFKTRPTGVQFRTYKFGYTDDNPSYDYLRYRILGEGGAGTIEESFYTLNLDYAKRYFACQLAGLYRDSGLLAIRDIYRKLTQRCLLNEYIVSPQFDVFVSFETMNNRGKNLSALELLKNRLIYLTTIYDDADLDSADRSGLRDAINGAWREIYRQLGRNKLRPLNDDDFLKAHWTMFFKYSRRTGRDYINFLLDEEFTPQKVHKKAEREVPGEVPEEQRSDLDLGDAEDDPSDHNEVSSEEPMVVLTAQLSPKEIREFVDSLKVSVVHWFNSWCPDMAAGMATEEQQWIERLNRVGITYFRPLVMAILKNEQSVEKRIEAFKSIERFIFVAFYLTAANRNYRSNEFLRAAREIERDGITVDVIRARLDAALAYAFDTDGTLRTGDFYNRLHKHFKSGDGYYDWAGLTYFLYEYELYLLSTTRQAKFRWTDLLKRPKDTISIEHIYPQTETPDWVESFGAIESGQRRFYNRTLGNLLLLSAAINSQLQNDSFEEKKKPKYNAAGVKSRNGYRDGSHSEIEVAEQDKWGPEEIYKRGIRLLSFMEWRWNFKIKNDDEKRRLLFPGFEEVAADPVSSPQ